MEDREQELRVATARPRRLLGWISATRGAITRWLRTRLRAVQGRHAVLVLTGVFFSGMMICMGYVADRANKAADAIDEAQRAQRLLGHVVESARASADADEEPSEEAEAEPTVRDHILFVNMTREP